MKELSIFVDESGDFGEYDYHSPYYIISMVFHDQDLSIESEIENLNKELSYIGLQSHCIHTGPIVRKEDDYKYMDVKERRRIFNKLIAFVRQVKIRYKCFCVEKKHIADVVEASGKLSKQISGFIRSHYEEFLQYDVIKIYYDNGQIEVNKILSSVFHALLPNIDFKKVVPSDYKLFQAADLLCTMELVRLKMEHGGLTKSEMNFFGNIRDLKKNYLKKLSEKEWK